MMGIKECTCRDEHWVLYGSVESLYCTPETDITLYVNSTRINFFLIKFFCFKRGAPGWLSQLNIRLLIFGLVHDLTACGFEPHVRLCAGGAEPAGDSLSPSLSAPPPLTHVCSLSQNE